MLKKTFHHSASRTDGIGRILQRLEQDKTLTHHVRSLLPQALAPHCHYCTTNHGRLLLYTDSSVWASRFFYHRNDILEGLNSLGCDTIRNVKVCVTHPVYTRTYKKLSALKPGLNVVSQIQQSSTTITDPKLKLSLKKLAETLSSDRVED